MTLRQRQNTARANIGAWNKSRYTDLNSAYGRCSTAKRNAWEYCEDLCRKKNGTDLRIISRNCYRFTAGFVYPDPKTG